jgi:hypothetical protein
MGEKGKQYRSKRLCGGIISPRRTTTTTCLHFEGKSLDLGEMNGRSEVLRDIKEKNFRERNSTYSYYACCLA